MLRLVASLRRMVGVGWLGCCGHRGCCGRCCGHWLAQASWASLAAPMAVVVLWGWPSTFIMDCVSPAECLVGGVSGAVGVGMFATWVVSVGFGVVGVVGGVDGARTR